MNSRDAQDVILRLLADGPYRTAAFAPGASLEPSLAAIVARVDCQALDRFGRFLCRHYYRERVVHYFKYARALAGRIGRRPEAVLKSAAFNDLMPQLVLGERRSAELVLELLRRHLTADADALRARLPYWDDLFLYQAAFFVSDALPSQPRETRFPARAETAMILELEWDLPAVLPQLLHPFDAPPMPERKPARLLFARSAQGEVTALRCTDALKDLLEGLTGGEDPAALAARLGMDSPAFENTLRRLEQLGAVVAQESFSSSHVGSDLPARA